MAYEKLKRKFAFWIASLGRLSRNFSWPIPGGGRMLFNCYEPCSERDGGLVQSQTMASFSCGRDADGSLRGCRAAAI
jgi:hypothetical protein